MTLPPPVPASAGPDAPLEYGGTAGRNSVPVGETSQGPTVAAIANALNDALGVRVRTLPLTQAQIVAAMPD